MNKNKNINKYILIIDDNESIQEALVWSLESYGHSILTASNGKEALSLIQKTHPPDLILLDMMMPIMDGTEFRKHQSQHSILHSIPTIILTAKQNVDIQLRSNEILLSKPFDLNQLIEIMKRWLI